MTLSFRALPAFLAAATSFGGAAHAADTLYPSTVTPVALTAPTYAQDFDTLAGTGSTGSNLPTGWQVFEGGANGNGTYGVGNGSSNAGNVYSFGSTGSTDRALGSLTSGNLTPTYIGAVFTNELGGTIDTLAISYFGEQWRNGSARDTLIFEYALGTTSLLSGTWVGVSDLDFLAPIFTGADRALDGNAAANRLGIDGTIAGLSIGAGETFAIRWRDLDLSGSDDALAIDDFRLTATLAAGAVPEPATWAMMIAGFGAVGGMMRRRRTAAALA